MADELENDKGKFSFEMPFPRPTENKKMPQSASVPFRAQTAPAVVAPVRHRPPTVKKEKGKEPLPPTKGYDSTSSTSLSENSMTDANCSTPSGNDSNHDENTSHDNTSSSDEETMKRHYLSLLNRRPELDELNEIKTTPIFTEAVRKYAHSLAGKGKAEKPFSQYGLVGGGISDASEGRGTTTTGKDRSNPRIFWNIAAPSSFFICGSQGSGKSHHLAVLLKNALGQCEAMANILPRPLTGIVFHYDTFISDTGGSPCEVAWLSSNPNIKVRVLCPPTNIRIMRKLYSTFPSITVQELRLNDIKEQHRAQQGAAGKGGIDWTPKKVDLSCPCVTAELAYSLSNICLSLFLEQDSAKVGRVVALDEAHKYMNELAECQTLTENLLSTIRLQRHLGARVLIATQEPTISHKLLDLCSVTVVHRFTSPD
ncbi:hypothetical protein B0H66DRAFT_598651 [Apodospora peruviana]|uniref:Zona occludens toxin N-terminal domain-containing protein n=1 Tax=Apodospora peruviana TaxID=516989 RepID=A0AAE0MFZ4_9PEZI|nr:hypothetical protein B0H66DRAFT_598651 [Apodospora peruviana]